MAKQKQDRFDGHAVNVYLDDDGDWLAHLVEMPEVSAFAATAEEALNELAQAWAGVRLSFEKRGEAAPVAPIDLTLLHLDIETVGFMANE